MTLRLEPLTIAMSDVAAALHEASGFHETWTADAFNGLLSAGADGLLAVSDETPVGLILWRVAADEAEILTICTLLAHRRLGVGRHLMEAAKAALKAVGIQRLLLEVAVDNDAAIALYRAFGFADAGRRRGYYTRPDGRADALVMGLTSL
jgi:[ribosomal protein S18]-alanine N-acetyltransferase